MYNSLTMSLISSTSFLCLCQSSHLLLIKRPLPFRTSVIINMYVVWDTSTLLGQLKVNIFTTKVSQSVSSRLDTE